MENRKGAAAGAIDSLPTQAVPPGGLLGAAGEKLSCAVCLEEFVEGAELRALPCLHKFHKSCIDRCVSACLCVLVCASVCMCTCLWCATVVCGWLLCVLHACDPAPGLLHVCEGGGAPGGVHGGRGTVGAAVLSLSRAAVTVRAAWVQRLLWVCRGCTARARRRNYHVTSALSLFVRCCCGHVLLMHNLLQLLLLLLAVCPCRWLGQKACCPVCNRELQLS